MRIYSTSISEIAMSKKGYILQSFRNQNATMDQIATTKSLTTLEKAIDEIYNSNASSLSFEELYRNAYHLCVHKHGDTLYDGILKGSLLRHIRKSLDVVISTPSSEFLDVMVREWISHHTSFNRLKDILLYMDRSYCIQKKKLTVYYYALQLFRDEIVYNENIKEKLRNLLLEQVTFERNGCVIDRNLMKNIISMLIILGSDNISLDSSQEPFNSYNKSYANVNCTNLIYRNPYEEEFESFYLIDTENYYRAESLDYLSENSCQDYLNKVESRFVEEVNRVASYLSSTTENKVRIILETELISAHAKVLLDMEFTGLDYMLNNHRVDDLAKLYNIFNRVASCFDLLRESIGKYIEKKGVEILNSQEGSKDAVQFVQRILLLKDRFDEIINSSMREDKRLLKQLKESFESFLNKDTRSASYLANYIDDLLKSESFGGGTGEDVELMLDKTMVIFRYISDKDLFENFYKILLSKRLLSGKVGSDENERVMIAKLKAECGYQFTSKLEGMLMDMNISRNVMDDFKKSLHFPGLHSTDFEVQLLTTGYWPLELPKSLVDLPPSMTDLCNRFNLFYNERNNGRRLLWLMNMGQVDLKANFPNGRRDLIVSTYQSILLLQFNSHTTLTLDSLRIATRIPELDLKRHLLSLCTSKIKILVKSSKSKGIENNDAFTFNSEFTSKMKRVKVPLVAKKEVSGEENNSGEVIPQAVEEDRRHMVEAAIVRIMKSRKTLSHNELIAEVTKQISVRFNPSPQFIKKRIESLIEREYLQRHEEDTRLYHYVA